MKEKKYPISNKLQSEVNYFIDFLKSEGNPDPDTIRTYENSIRRALYTIGKKDIIKISKSDLDKFFSGIKISTTKELIKTKFRVFLRYKKLNGLADQIKIDASVFKKSTKTDNDVLTPKEIELIRNSTNSNRDLAMFELFLTTGIRREELATLKVQNIEITKDEIKVKVTKSKTKPRTVSIIPYPGNPIAFYPRHFVSYFNNHPFRDNPSFPLFYSTDYRKPNTAFEEHAINQIIHKVQKKAGITKNITPHILRHTASTWDGYHLTEANLVLKYAHSPEVARRYCHINEEQFSGFLKQKAGLTPQTVEKESKCPYCGHVNNINDINCFNCKRTINREEMAKQFEKQEEREKIVSKQLEDYEKRLQRIEKNTNFYLDPNNPETKTMIDSISNEFGKIYGVNEGQVKNEIVKGLFNLRKYGDINGLLEAVEKRDFREITRRTKDKE